MMDFPFVLKIKQLDYSACHFMQHVFILLAFKVFSPPTLDGIPGISIGDV